MSLQKVTDYLKGFNLDKNIIILKDYSATVELAAKALGCECKQIAKSMSFDVNNKTIIVVLAGDTKTDNAKFKNTFGVKAKMLSFEEVESRTGHMVGGVCPFAVNSDVKTYLDVSLKRFEYVYPAAGTDHSAVKLTLQELEKSSSNFCGWVDVGKIMQ